MSIDKPGVARTAIVVNDEPVQRNLLSQLLKSAGLEVQSFESAEGALAAMDRAHPPALIVTDLYMPGIDGWRFCRLLRSPEYAPFGQVPLLVVSATFAGDETSRIAADLGAEAFLPCPVDSEQFIQQVRAILGGERMRTPLRVLIVEDSKSQALAFRKAFQAHGYEAETAFTVRAAEEAFHKTAYDLAVLDYHLPDGSGDALLDQFRVTRPDCVCLMVTSDTQRDLALKWMKQGAAAYLHKPFKLEYLIDLCAKARRERALLHVQDLLQVRTTELRESEARYRLLVEHLDAGVVVHAPDTSIRFANSAAARILGLTQDELLGKTTPDPAWCFVREDGSRLPVEEYPVARVLSTLAPFTGQVVGVHRPAPHDQAWALVSAYPVFQQPYQLEQVVISFVDITACKRAEADKAKLETQYQQTQKMESVGRLAGGVAHDFNNMLQAILGNVELAVAGVPQGNPIRGSLEEIRRCAQHSADLTRQLLAFARKQTVSPKVLDLNEAVENSLKMLRRLIGEGTQLVWLPASGLGSVRIDPVQVDQILANLCVNARDAIAGVGQVTIKTANQTLDRAYCAVHPEFLPGEYVRLTVSDDGHGMDPETLTHIFEPFFTTKGVGEGTGLGLATIYGILRQNAGFIGVHSEPDQGTTFDLYFPRLSQPVSSSPAERIATRPPNRRETVLLVEDEPAILVIAEKILAHLGYTVLTANSPSEAIRLAEGAGCIIHLLITDVVMPEMNARELAQRLLRLHPKLKCLFMSGYTADVISQNGVLDEGVNFIQKPFTMDGLAEKVRALLDSTDAQE